MLSRLSNSFWSRLNNSLHLAKNIGGVAYQLSHASLGCTCHFFGISLLLNFISKILSINCRTCEICCSTARNVAGVNEVELAEQWNEANDTVMPPAPVTTTQPAENRNFWQGHRFLNFLLACMVFAFVISWLFHFNVPS